MVSKINKDVKLKNIINSGLVGVLVVLCLTIIVALSGCEGQGSGKIDNSGGSGSVNVNIDNEEKDKKLNVYVYEYNGTTGSRMIGIVNKANFDITGCKIILNGRYIYTKGLVDIGSTYMVGYNLGLQFASASGDKPEAGTINNYIIECNEGTTSGATYKG